MKDGIGIYIFPDQTRYKGDFVNNVIEGYGQFTYPNGDTYEGMTKEGKYHGEGTFKAGSKEQVKEYKGQWLNGVKHGKGRELIEGI